MLQIIVMALPFSLAWMVLSNEITLPSFIVGYILGFAILFLLYRKIGTNKINLIKLPVQVFWLIYYIGILAVDILLSGVDVARRVLHPGPDLPINPDIQKVYTQDETRDPIISAMSAHAITITPGEMVIDYDEEDPGGVVMYVHALDIDECKDELDRDQTRRLRLFNRILGHSEKEETT